MIKLLNYVKKSLFVWISLALFLPDVCLGQTTKAIAVAGGERHSAALKDDGTVWTWGENSGGQLGDGSGEDQYNAVQVLDLEDPIGYLTGVTAIAAGTEYWLDIGGHTIALKGDGTVFTWGFNWNGQLGDGTQVNRSTAVQVVDPTDPSGYLTGAAAVGAGDRHTMVVKNDGTVCTWGDNAYGQLGDGTNENKLTPVQVAGLTDVSAVTGGAIHTLALKGSGTVWAWGANGSGQLGDGTSGWPASKTSPVQVIDPSDPTGYLTNIIAIAAGDEHSLALKSDGTVWSWGANPFGQLGDGTWGWAESKNTPVQVTDPSDPTGYLTGIIAIAGGDDYSLALQNDGTVCSWGANNWGQLGDGTTVDKNTPVQVSGLTNIIAIGAGNGHSLAVKNDGTVWAWGGNWSGQLGDGTTEQRTSPVQVVFAEKEESLLDVKAPYLITPGEEITILIFYENILEETLQDAVVLVDLPSVTEYVSSEHNGIYRDDGHQIFWKLGNVDSGASGALSFKLEVEWGLAAHLKMNLFADIGARNIETSFDLDEYLNYSDREIVSATIFSAEEINTLLSNNPELKSLFDYAQGIGYQFDEVAREFNLSDGSSTIVFAMISPNSFGPAFLHLADGNVFIQRFDENGYAILNEDGGYSVDLNQNVTSSWGTWAESHSLQLHKCIANCVWNNVKNWSLYIRDVWKGNKRRACVMCQEAYKKGQWNSLQCGLCAEQYMEVHKKRMNRVQRGLKYGKPISKCIDECESSPYSHQCIEGTEFTNCEPAMTIFTRLTTVGLKGGVWSKYRCEKGLWKGVYLGYCYNNTVCRLVKGEAKCVDPCKNTTNTLKSKVFSSVTGCARNMVAVPVETATARDPNAKHVDALGDVIPGQTLNYTIEYENEGEGTAYEVFIIDELCSELDESTLVINDGGDYSEDTRTLSWDIGELSPGGKGSVGFSVNLKEGLISGTEVTNYADVHFPSVPEITPTNPVVNVVKSIVADPQTHETTSGTPLSITLTGRDSGTNTLTYAITSDPFYGELAGTPPNVIYTSMDEFSGQDEFYFVVNNGIIDSDPAKVTIKVNPNSSDTNPPEVIDTYPEAEAINVHIDDTPISTDPEQYIPTITATFSESVDSETVTDSTFTVDGLTGTIYYDEQLRTAYFIPSSTLTRSTTYTARLGTGVKDKAGIPMTSEYTWQFTTESPINIAVTLPDNADEVDFGDVLINCTSSDEIVSISSTGTLDLELGIITLTGTNSGEFRIIEDNCSGETLTQFDNCTVKVVFEPKSTGIKSAHLSIPSNDPDENPVDVPISGSGVTELVTTSTAPSSTTTTKSSAPCLCKKIYGEGSEQAELLRNFRDNILSQTPEGQELIRLYYQWCPAIFKVMEEDDEFREEVKELIDGVLPLMREVAK